jgi:hypothetical protein
LAGREIFGSLIYTKEQNLFWEILYLQCMEPIQEERQ